MFEKNNKQNIYSNLGALKLGQTNKSRTNIGQQIRKKLKIKSPSSEMVNALMPRNQNIIKDQKISLNNKISFERVPMMQRSVQYTKETSRSVKSVRFEQQSNKPQLTRKHSTSSILKNNKIVKKPRLSEKNSINNSVCSNILKDNQSTQNQSFNKIAKQKYQKVLQSLRKTDKMYVDDLFPQVQSSISRMKNPNLKQVKWMRLTQIFAGRCLTVWDSNQNIKVIAGEYPQTLTMATCFNSIKHNNFLLQKMFESQKFNQNGVYYVKINQNNTWKYVVIDDYIPVIKQDKKLIPAFLNVTCFNPNHVQIWPFLLQKAYAKYYSNYQSLLYCNQLDFIQQITGCYPEEWSPNTFDFQQICHEINSYDSILICKDYLGKYHPMVPRKIALTCQDPQIEFFSRSYTHQQFKQKYCKVYCILLHKYFYSGFCTIKHSSESQNHNHISLRTIKIEEANQCVFSVVQKDIKHYYSGDYKYVWVRMIVIMKQSDKNYRWIGGVYKNLKYACFSAWLQPAQYMVFIIPQWRNKGFDLNFNFQGNIKVNIDRKPYAGNQQILIEGAMDLAQSKGKLKQLNPNICTYSYIQQNLGLIIENINNERPNGYVRILRSIEGLQKSGQNLIKAFNIQFRFTPTIQVKIDCLQHFTVVLAVQNGVNKAFLDQFDFGS